MQDTNNNNNAADVDAFSTNNTDASEIDILNLYSEIDIMNIDLDEIDKLLNSVTNITPTNDSVTQTLDNPLLVQDAQGTPVSFSETITNNEHLLTSNTNHQVSDSSHATVKSIPPPQIYIGPHAHWPFIYSEDKNAYILDTDLDEFKYKTYKQLHDFSERMNGHAFPRPPVMKVEKGILQMSYETFHSESTIPNQKLITWPKVEDSIPTLSTDKEYFIDIACKELQYNNYPQIIKFKYKNNYDFELQNGSYMCKVNDARKHLKQIGDIYQRSKIFELPFSISSDNNYLTLSKEKYQKFINNCIQYSIIKTRFQNNFKFIFVSLMAPSDNLASQPAEKKKGRKTENSKKRNTTKYVSSKKKLVHGFFAQTQNKVDANATYNNSNISDASLKRKDDDNDDFATFNNYKEQLQYFASLNENSNPVLLLNNLIDQTKSQSSSNKLS